MASRFLETIPPGVVDERTTSSMLSSWSGRSSGRGTSWSGGRSGSGGGFRSTSKPAAAPIRSVAPSTPAPEEVSQDTPRYVKGERVRHRRFGGGTILGLAGTGKDLKVTVRFDNEEVGQKQLLVAYAGLERDWESA
jgi:DNA helicase-2/ATP-dependent DNA helicase PcrA